MRRNVLATLLVAAVFGARGSAAPEEKPLAERVNAAIEAGVKWLRERQLPDGSWGSLDVDKSYTGGSAYDYPAGPTAFALYTLLKCEVPASDPGIQRGFEALRKRTDFYSTYEIASAMLAVEAKYDQAKRSDKDSTAAGLTGEAGGRAIRRVKPSKEDAAWMRKLTDGLVDHFKAGGWRYQRVGPHEPGAQQDTSNTAFSMLAILAAHRCGVDVPRKVLTQVVEWLAAEQDVAGPDAGEYKPRKGAAANWTPPAGSRARGWAYCRKTDVPSEPTTTTGNMTTAGIISLLAAQHVLEDTGPEALKSLQPVIDRCVTDGLTWLAFHWRIDANPKSEHFYHYMYLYGLERIGDLRRVALVAGHDWYGEGARVLLAEQQTSGCWFKTDTHKPYDLVNTCFALLFLDRASLVVTTPR